VDGEPEGHRTRINQGVDDTRSGGVSVRLTLVVGERTMELRYYVFHPLSPWRAIVSRLQHSATVRRLR